MVFLLWQLRLRYQLQVGITNQSNSKIFLIKKFKITVFGIIYWFLSRNRLFNKEIRISGLTQEKVLGVLRLNINWILVLPHTSWVTFNLKSAFLIYKCLFISTCKVMSRLNKVIYIKLLLQWLAQSTYQGKESNCYYYII